jgi:hypothetical protein
VRPSCQNSIRLLPHLWNGSATYFTASGRDAGQNCKSQSTISHCVPGSKSDV